MDTHTLTRPERHGSRSGVELACAWSGVAFLATYLVFFAGVAGWLPPHPPSWSIDQVASLYAEDTTRIRIGQVGAMAASFFMFPMWALISAHIARIELRRGRLPLLAVVQFGNAVLLQVFFVLCSMVWLIASFRPGLAPEVLRVLHEGSWLIFVMVAPGYLMQMICIGIAAFLDDSAHPVFPRWAGYLHLWVGLSGLGGLLAVFFKSGPFAWNGVVGFWLPVAMFAVWLVVITRLLHKSAMTDAVLPGHISDAPGRS